MGKSFVILFNMTSAQNRLQALTFIGAVSPARMCMCMRSMQMCN
jgi:hypothetical protein